MKKYFNLYARKFLSYDCDFLQWRAEAEAVLAAVNGEKDELCAHT